MNWHSRCCHFTSKIDNKLSWPHTKAKWKKRSFLLLDRRRHLGRQEAFIMQKATSAFSLEMDFFLGRGKRKERSFLFPSMRNADEISTRLDWIMEPKAKQI